MFTAFKNSFEPEKSFFELNVVKYTIYSIVILTLISSSIIIFKDWDTLTLGGHYQDFNNFFDVFKFPIALLALLIPLMAIYAANHRSEQTRHQMMLLSSQNNFVNYYQHISHFKTYLEDISSDNSSIKKYDYRHLHRRIFPKHIDGVPRYSADPEFIRKLEDTFGAIYKELIDLKDNDSRLRVHSFLNITRLIKSLTGSLKLIYASIPNQKNYNNNGEVIRLISDGSLNSLILRLNFTVRYLDSILDFSDEYETPAIFDFYLNIDRQHIPSDFNHENLVKNEQALPIVEIQKIFPMLAEHAANASER